MSLTISEVEHVVWQLLFAIASTAQAALRGLRFVLPMRNRSAEMDDNLLAVRLRVGRKVRELRRLSGLTQEQLAEFVGNQHKHIGQVERGKVNVGIDVLTRIARSLQVDISELFRPAAGEESRPSTYIVPRQIFEQVDDALRALDHVKRTYAARERQPSAIEER